MISVIKMSDRRFKHKNGSRTNERTVRAMMALIRDRKREWDEAGIIPKIRRGKVVTSTTKQQGEDIR